VGGCGCVFRLAAGVGEIRHRPTRQSVAAYSRSIASSATDCCVKRAAAAHLRLPAPLSGAKSSFPQSRAACAGLQRAHTGRQAPGHLGEILHRPWVLCPAPCLVHIAACRCACPLPQAPPALRALCRGWIQRACTGQQAPVDPRDSSLAP